MKGTIQYFDIEKLGIYKRGSNELLFNSQKQILESLDKWVNSRPDTVNTLAAKAEKHLGQNNIYCCDSFSSDGEFIFILWNELTNQENEILTLAKSSKPGELSVKTGIDSKKSIPGLPSYYWVSLRNKTIATISFEHSITSIGAFKNYVKAFVDNYSNFAVTSPENENKVIGYCNPENTKEKGLFKLDLRRAIDKSTVEELAQKVNLIKKVVRKTKKSVQSVKNGNIIQSLFSNLASDLIGRGLPEGRETSIEIELDFTPKSSEEFQKIVLAYQKEILEPDRYNNLGFILKGNSQKTIFLDGKFKRFEHDFDLKRQSKNPFQAKELLDYIQEKQRVFGKNENIEAKVA